MGDHSIKRPVSFINHPRCPGKRRTTGENAGRVTVRRRIECNHRKSVLKERADQRKELGRFSRPTMHQKNPPLTIPPAISRDIFLFIFSAGSNHDPANLCLLQDCVFPFQVSQSALRPQKFL
jgi:hypothetical protein